MYRWTQSVSEAVQCPWATTSQLRHLPWSQCAGWSRESKPTLPRQNCSLYKLHSPAASRLFLSQPQICHFPPALSQSPQTYYHKELWTTITSGFNQKAVMSKMNILHLDVCVRLLMYKLIRNSVDKDSSWWNADVESPVLGGDLSLKEMLMDWPSTKHNSWTTSARCISTGVSCSKDCHQEEQ